MGKGDKKTKRGKIILGSTGKTRLKKVKKSDKPSLKATQKAEFEKKKPVARKTPEIIEDVVKNQSLETEATQEESKATKKASKPKEETAHKQKKTNTKKAESEE